MEHGLCVECRHRANSLKHKATFARTRWGKVEVIGRGFRPAVDIKQAGSDGYDDDNNDDDDQAFQNDAAPARQTPCIDSLHFRVLGTQLSCSLFHIRSQGQTFRGDHFQSVEVDVIQT